MNSMLAFQLFIITACGFASFQFLSYMYGYFAIRPLQVVLLFPAGPGFFQGPCRWAVNQHHSHQYKPIRLSWNANILSLNICTSLHACGIQTTEDAKNLEIARSMHAGGGPDL